MVTYTCEHCGTQNYETGECNYCHRPLGSRIKAIYAAMIASAILSVSWIVIAYFAKNEMLILPVFFGFIISIAVTRFSAGIGYFYQYVASGFTVAAFSFSFVFIRYLLPVNSDEQVKASLQQIILNELFDNPIVFLSFIISISCGLFIWKKIKF